MDNTSLYTTRGTSYESARPGYPDELMNYLYTTLCFDKAKAIADIGSGTGKFTRLLLERGESGLCCRAECGDADHSGEEAVCVSGISLH